MLLIFLIILIIILTIILHQSSPPVQYNAIQYCVVCTVQSVYYTAQYIVVQ